LPLGTPEPVEVHPPPTVGPHPIRIETDVNKRYFYHPSMAFTNQFDLRIANCGAEHIRSLTIHLVGRLFEDDGITREIPSGLAPSASELVGVECHPPGIGEHRLGLHATYEVDGKPRELRTPEGALTVFVQHYGHEQGTHYAPSIIIKNIYASDPRITLAPPAGGKSGGQAIRHEISGGVPAWQVIPLLSERPPEVDEDASGGAPSVSGAREEPLTSLEDARDRCQISPDEAMAAVDLWSEDNKRYLWPLSDFVDIEDVLHRDGYHIRSVALTEERRLDFNRVPHARGEPVDCKPFGEPGKWSVDFTVPTGLDDRECEWRGTDPDRVQTCTECRGTGLVMCDGCRGSGRYADDCRPCDGTGQISTGKREEPCPSCGSTGRRDCSICGGSRRVVRDVWSRCEACRGAGRVSGPCRRCGGRGEVGCLFCEGKGALLFYPVVRANFRAARRERSYGADTQGADYAGLAGRMGVSLWRARLDGPNWPELPSFVPESVRLEAAEWLGQNRGLVDVRTHRCELSVEYVPVHVCVLRYQGRPVTVWLGGLDRTVWLTDGVPRNSGRTIALLASWLLLGLALGAALLFGSEAFARYTMEVPSFAFERLGLVAARRATIIALCCEVAASFLGLVLVGCALNYRPRCAGSKAAVVVSALLTAVPLVLGWAAISGVAFAEEPMPGPGWPQTQVSQGKRPAGDTVQRSPKGRLLAGGGRNVTSFCATTSSVMRLIVTTIRMQGIAKRSDGTCFPTLRVGPTHMHAPAPVVRN